MTTALWCCAVLLGFFVVQGVRSSSMKGTITKWPGGTVYVNIANEFSNDEQQVILGAMRYMESHSCIRFVNRTDQADYIKITRNSQGCWSYVGRIGGVQQLNLHGGCLHREVRHVLMHALGFYHEETRSDRDEHVIINWSNILPENRRNFELRDTDNLNTSYDYSSIMHSDVFDFAINRTIPVIIPKQPQHARSGNMKLPPVRWVNSYAESVPATIPVKTTVSRVESSARKGITPVTPTTEKTRLKRKENNR